MVIFTILEKKDRRLHHGVGSTEIKLYTSTHSEKLLHALVIQVDSSDVAQASHVFFTIWVLYIQMY